VQRVFQRQQQVCEAAKIQFIKGVDEPTVPEVALKRNRNGTAGTAIFVFENPSIFQASSELGDITGVWWGGLGKAWGQQQMARTSTGASATSRVVWSHKSNNSSGSSSSTITCGSAARFPPSGWHPAPCHPTHPSPRNLHHHITWLPHQHMLACTNASTTRLCPPGAPCSLAGLFMIDDEGQLSTTDVKAKFINGKPQAIEARYQMRSEFEWDRFIRFMDRWAGVGGGWNEGDG
jgi:hypothetical protein